MRNHGLFSLVIAGGLGKCGLGIVIGGRSFYWEAVAAYLNMLQPWLFHELICFSISDFTNEHILYHSQDLSGWIPGCS